MWMLLALFNFVYMEWKEGGGLNEDKIKSLKLFLGCCWIFECIEREWENTPLEQYK